MKFSKPLFIRFILFVVGGVLSIGINEFLYWLLRDILGWDSRVAYGVSLTTITVLLFLWNYVVGFKTNRHWTDSAWRQIVCQIVAFGLNYALVIFLHSLFPDWEKLAIAAVQIFIAFFKFGIYHYWVYPQASPELAPENATRVP